MSETNPQGESKPTVTAPRVSAVCGVVGVVIASVSLWFGTGLHWRSNPESSSPTSDMLPAGALPSEGRQFPRSARVPEDAPKRPRVSLRLDSSSKEIIVEGIRSGFGRLFENAPSYWLVGDFNGWGYGGGIPITVDPGGTARISLQRLPAGPQRLNLLAAPTEGGGKAWFQFGLVKDRDDGLICMSENDDEVLGILIEPDRSCVPWRSKKGDVPIPIGPTK